MYTLLPGPMKRLIGSRDAADRQRDAVARKRAAAQRREMMLESEAPASDGPPPPPLFLPRQEPPSPPPPERRAEAPPARPAPAPAVRSPPPASSLRPSTAAAAEVAASPSSPVPSSPVPSSPVPAPIDWTPAPALSAGEVTSTWAVAFVVVKFDLELGAVLEKVVPEGALNTEQQREMCYIGFPDSNASITRDCCYVIKPYSCRSEGYFNYGYVYFRQKKDSSVRRGFLQHSLILLSRWPFTGVLETVVKRVAQRYFALCPVSPSHGTQATTCTTREEYAPLTYQTRELSGVSGSPDTASPLDVVAAPPGPGTAEDTRGGAWCPFSRQVHATGDVDPAVAAPVAAAVAAAAAVAVQVPRLLEPRFRVLQDALLDMAAWAAPEANSEYAFCLFGQDVQWRAPDFTVTSRRGTLNYCAADNGLKPMSPGRGMLPSPRPLQEEDRRRRSSVATAAEACNAGAASAARLLGRLSGTRHVFSEVPVYTNFQTQLRRLWQLWELALIAEPLCVLTTSPTVSSAAVLSIVSLIHPITYCGDFRPYFAVQDPEFKQFARYGSAGHPFPKTGGPIVGCTNPYFAKALAAWPHLVTLHDHSIPGGVEAKRVRDKELNRRMGRNAGRHRSQRERLLWEFTETFVTDRAFTVNDTDSALAPVLSQLLRTPGQGVDAAALDQVNTEILRRAFMELTDSFLEPLRRCFDSLWQAMAMPLILKSTNRAVFTADAFRDDLRRNGYVRKAFKRGRADVLRLYDAFFESPHFPNWVEEQITARIRAGLTADDVAADRSDEQRIDLYLKLSDDLQRERGRMVKDRLLEQLLAERCEALLMSLPDHLRGPVARRRERTRRAHSAASTPLSPPSPAIELLVPAAARPEEAGVPAPLPAGALRMLAAADPSRRSLCERLSAASRAEAAAPAPAGPPAAVAPPLSAAGSPPSAAAEPAAAAPPPAAAAAPPAPAASPPPAAAEGPPAAAVAGPPLSADCPPAAAVPPPAAAVPPPAAAVPPPAAAAAEEEEPAAAVAPPPAAALVDPLVEPGADSPPAAAEELPAEAAQPAAAAPAVEEPVAAAPLPAAAEEPAAAATPPAAPAAVAEPAIAALPPAATSPPAAAAPPPAAAEEPSAAAAEEPAAAAPQQATAAAPPPAAAEEASTPPAAAAEATPPAAAAPPPPAARDIVPSAALRRVDG